MNITPSTILMNQYHSQRHFENNSPLISKVTNKSNDKNISGTNLLNESLSKNLMFTKLPKVSIISESSQKSSDHILLECTFGSKLLVL